MSCSCHISQPCSYCVESYECSVCNKIFHPDDRGMVDIDPPGNVCCQVCYNKDSATVDDYSLMIKIMGNYPGREREYLCEKSFEKGWNAKVLQNERAMKIVEAVRRAVKSYESKKYFDHDLSDLAKELGQFDKGGVNEAQTKH